MGLTLLDDLILAVPLAIVMAVALYMRRYMRSVSDFLAASRCAGRYLICSSSGELNAAVIGLVTALETFSQTGASMDLWNRFSSVVFFLFTLFGVISFRFRETRCLTFHQFLEVRYSKSIRILASSMNIFSALINFGLVPAVGGRFFVYFCDLPENCFIAGREIPTYALVMIALMLISLVMAVTGGQISVMVTDCIEGLISGFLYLVVIAFILLTIPLGQMKDALLSGHPGNSYVNPFDIGGRSDFNGWYVILLLIFNVYIFRGNTWLQGFSAAAKTAHEGVMAAILASWRAYAAGAMGALVSLGAFTLLHHAAFSTDQSLIHEKLGHIASVQVRTEMQMPLALSLLLAPGIKGAFCAICLFGTISSQGALLHNYGSTLLQDAILPLFQKPLSPRIHLLALRLSATAIAIVVCTFSLLYQPVDYLAMLVMLIGAIYLGGMGAVTWGGLYWKKGTTAGAMTALITGSLLAIILNLVQQFWGDLQPTLLSLAGRGSIASYLAAHPDHCPVNGQALTTATAMIAFASYIIVSLATCRQDFNMDRMLHRGPYAIAGEDDTRSPVQRGFSWGGLIGINEHFSRGDKILSLATFLWVIAWQVFAAGVMLWCLFVGQLSDRWWFQYIVVSNIIVPVTLGIITTIWFTIGSTRDIIDLLHTLRTTARNDRDDGTVRNHHNLGEP